jgi:hypothetical protein
MLKSKFGWLGGIGAGRSPRPGCTAPGSADPGMTGVAGWARAAIGMPHNKAVPINAARRTVLASMRLVVLMCCNAFTLV